MVVVCMTQRIRKGLTYGKRWPNANSAYQRHNGSSASRSKHVLDDIFATDDLYPTTWKHLFIDSLISIDEADQQLLRELTCCISVQRIK